MAAVKSAVRSVELPDLVILSALPLFTLSRAYLNTQVVQDVLIEERTI